MNKGHMKLTVDSKEIRLCCAFATYSDARNAQICLGLDGVRNPKLSPTNIKDCILSKDVLRAGCLTICLTVLVCVRE